jgi:hypothetical protein
MKSFICFIFLSFLSFDTIVLNANNCLPLENVTLSLEEKVAYEKYRVTARTRNSYGENYWVDLVVEGQVSSLGNTIYRVYYNDGYGLKSLTYMMEYGYDNTYYVYLDGNNYYFEF